MAEKEETKRVKHIDVKFHFIQEAVAEEKVRLANQEAGSGHSYKFPSSF